MSGSFSIYFAGMFVAGLGTLLCIVFAIIMLATGKNRQAGFWAIGLVGSLVVLGVSIVGFINTLSDKVYDTTKKWGDKFEAYEEYGDEYQKNERQYWLDTLELYTNELYRNKMPKDYYKNEKVAPDSVTGRMTLPFVFPYSISYSPDTYTGHIMANDSIFVHNVSEFAFDENFVIAKVSNVHDKALLKKGSAEIEYLLFDLRTGNYESVPNKEKLMDMAARIGYTGPSDMKYLSDAYRGWVDSYNVYD